MEKQTIHNKNEHFFHYCKGITFKKTIAKVPYTLFPDICKNFSGKTGAESAAAEISKKNFEAELEFSSVFRLDRTALRSYL